MDKFIPGDSKIPTRACLSSSAANLELVLKAREKAPEARVSFLSVVTKQKVLLLMQNKPTLIQRSTPAAAMQGPVPLTGLVPSGQMWKEHTILLSFRLTPRVRAGTTI